MFSNWVPGGFVELLISRGVTYAINEERTFGHHHETQTCACLDGQTICDAEDLQIVDRFIHHINAGPWNCSKIRYQPCLLPFSWFVMIISRMTWFLWVFKLDLIFGSTRVPEFLFITGLLLNACQRQRTISEKRTPISLHVHNTCTFWIKNSSISLINCWI